MRDIRVFDDAASLAQRAADYVYHSARQTIAERGRFVVALSGGSTPRTMNTVLAERYADKLDWSKVYVLWGDERAVPPDHPDSNYGMAQETLLSKVSVPSQNILRIKGELAPEMAAVGYEELLAATFGTEQPFLDLVFLGMGEDGHTLSIFPHTDALHETGLVAANFVPKLDTWRITLTTRAVNDYARTVVFLVSGAAKADTLNKVLNGAYNPDELPAQLIDPQAGVLIWMVDRAAYPSK